MTDSVSYIICAVLVFCVIVDNLLVKTASSIMIIELTSQMFPL